MADDVYLVNKLCHRVFHDVAFRDAVKRDPAGTIASWAFSDEVRKAVLEGNVAQLYEWGAHPFLLAHFTRWELFGLTRPLYNQRMQHARDPLDADGWYVRTQFPVSQ